MNLYRIVSWTLVVIIMAIIFNLSSQAAQESNELSKGVTEIIIEAVEKVAPSVELEVKDLNHIIRKNAHFFFYLILGLSMINAFKASSIYGYKGIVFSVGLCVFYAILDEIHQLFVPGRGGQVKDVLIDSAGSVVGIIIYLAINQFLKEKRIYRFR